MRKNLFLLFCGLFITATVCSQEYIFKPITSLADIQDGDEVIIVAEGGNPTSPDATILYHSNSSLKGENALPLINNRSISTADAKYIFKVKKSGSSWGLWFEYSGSNRYVYPNNDDGTSMYINLKLSTSTSAKYLAPTWKTNPGRVFLGYSSKYYLGCKGTAWEPLNGYSNYDQIGNGKALTSMDCGALTIFKKYPAYTLTFDAGEGSCSTASQIGGSEKLPIAIPTDHSKTFIGWKDANGTIHRQGVPYPLDESVLTANETLHAVYKQATLTYEQIIDLSQIQYGDTLIFTMADGNGGTNEYGLFRTGKVGTTDKAMQFDKTANLHPLTQSVPDKFKFVVFPTQYTNRYFICPPDTKAWMYIAASVGYYSSSNYNWRMVTTRGVDNGTTGALQYIHLTACGNDNGNHFYVSSHDDKYYICYTVNEQNSGYWTVHGSSYYYNQHDKTSPKNLSADNSNSSTSVKRAAGWTIYRSYWLTASTCTFVVDNTKGSCDVTEISESTFNFPNVETTSNVYTFVGWRDESGNLYQAGDEYLAKDDMTFTAEFELTHFRLNLNGHGTWEEGGEQVKDIDGRYIENYPTVIPKDGYRFSGWSLTSAGEPLPAGRYPATGEINQTTTLYAVYAATVVYLPIRSNSEIVEGKDYILGMQGGINQDEVYAVGFTPSTLQVVDLSSHSKNGAITFPPAKVIMSPARKSTWDDTQWVFKYSDNGKDYFVYPVPQVVPGGTIVQINSNTSSPSSANNSFSVWVSSDSHVTIHNTYSMFLSNNSWYIESSTPTNQFNPPTSLANASRPSIFTLYRKYDAEQITLDAGGAICPITKAYGAINALPLVFRIVDDQKQEVYWWEDEEGNHYMPGTRFPTSGAVESPVTLTAIYRTYDVKYQPIEALTDMQAGDTIALVVEDGDGGNNRFALQIGQGTLTTSAFDATNVPLSQRIVVVEKDYVYKSVNNTDTYLTSASFRSGAYPTYNLIRYEPNWGSSDYGDYTFQSATSAAHKYALYIPNDAFPSHVQIFDVYNSSSYNTAISLVYSPSSNTVSTRQQANTFTCYCDQFTDNKALSAMSSAATWTIYKRHIKYAYPITYDANGGTISPTTVCGWDITLAAATAPIGYEQIGWATTQANADNQIADAGEVGDSYEASEPITLFAVYKPIVLTLTESESNSELLATYNSQQVAQIDMNRTVTPNQLNTFCAPFDMDEQEIKNVFGADTKLYEMASADLNGEILTIHFDDVEPMAIAAGYPYLIEPTQTINDELFTVHTISNTLTTQTTGNVDFIPVFDPTILSVDSDILFLGASNLLYRPYTTGQIKGLRAYFQLKNGAQVAQRVVLSSVRQIPTALPATNQLINARKVIRKGQLFIYVNDKIYNAQGIQY